MVEDSPVPRNQDDVVGLGLPLAALAPEAAVYVSGLSKSIATGLRVGFVAAPLPVKVHAGVAGIIRRGLPVVSLALELLCPAHASISVPSTVKCSSESKPCARACSTTR